MSVIWQKVWSDLWDNKIRTILAVLSIAVGVFAVGVTFGMSDQLLSGMDAAHQASLPAHFTLSLVDSASLGRRSPFCRDHNGIPLAMQFALHDMIAYLVHIKRDFRNQDHMCRA